MKRWRLVCSDSGMEHVKVGLVFVFDADGPPVALGADQVSESGGLDRAADANVVKVELLRDQPVLVEFFSDDPSALVVVYHGNVSRDLTTPVSASTVCTV